MVICNRIGQNGSVIRFLVGIVLLCMVSSCHTAKNGVNNSSKENASKELEKEFPEDVSHRNSAEIFDKDCEEISRDELREGDLVFFTNDSGRRINHVGIYLYDDKFIHSSSSKGVVISDLKQNYYVKHFYKAARVQKTN